MKTKEQSAEIANPKAKIVYWKNGNWEIVKDGITWEYENDPDWDRTEDYK